LFKALRAFKACGGQSCSKASPFKGWVLKIKDKREKTKVQSTEQEKSAPDSHRGCNLHSEINMVQGFNFVPG